MFEKTKLILEATESSLLGFDTTKEFLKPFQRLVFYPFLFIKMGFEDLTKPLMLWSFITFVILILINLIGEVAVIVQGNFFIALNLYSLVVLLLISFSTPSAYAFYGAQTSSIQRTVNILSEYKIDTVDDVELLENNVDLIEERIDERCKFYKWLIAFVWGGYILALNFQFRFMGLSGLKPDDEFVSGLFDRFLYLSLFLIVSLMLMICYKRASKMLIFNLKFACVQQKSVVKNME